MKVKQLVHKTIVMAYSNALVSCSFIVVSVTCCMGHKVDFLLNYRLNPVNIILVKWSNK